MKTHFRKLPLWLLLTASVLGPATSHAGCAEPEPESVSFGKCRSVAEVDVRTAESFLAADQSIRTRYLLKVVERFKGDVPGEVEIISTGGKLGNRCDFSSSALTLEVGKSYVLLLDRDAAGIWQAHPHRAFRAPKGRPEVAEFFRNRARGKRPPLIPAAAEIVTAQANANGIPGSVVTPTGYTETGGQPTRFTTCDGDEPIPYVIDIDPTQLPTGMDQAEAIATVAEICNVWAAQSSLKFRFDGLVTFAGAASSVTTQDRQLRIQLHDNFNVLSAGTLGVGGGSFTSATTTFNGGRVGTQGFQERLYGYVTLESVTNAPSLLNVANFKRVLTHEIGHALGLAHSSNNPTEPNPILKAATMYYTAIADSTGATIQAYDVDRIQFGYPTTDTPPFTTDRVLQAVTSSNYALLPAVLGVNRIQLRAIDRQGTPLTASITSSSSPGGSFSLSGNTLIYTPNANYGDARLTDAEILAGTAYGRAAIQFSDGVNLSRPVSCIITGTSNDTSPSDGLPNSWMLANFGAATPGPAGSARHPESDPDGDGLNNRAEFYLNTNPNSATSGPVKPTYNGTSRQLSFTPVRFAPYWIETSSTLAPGSWTLRKVSTLYQPPGTLVSDFSSASAPGKEFYRVVTGP